MRDFDYVAPETVQAAVALLEEHGERARVLAGGTDLIPQLREGQRVADIVVDIKKIPELTSVDFRPDGSLRLGAAVPFHRLWSDPDIAKAYPALTDASRIIGGWQIQSRACPGGNLCNSSPAADTTPALIAEGATCEIAGPAGRRSVAAAHFCAAPGKNVLAPGELLVSFELPAPVADAGSRYLRFIPRNEMDIAVVGSGVWLQVEGDTVTDARIALAAVGPTVVDATEAAASLIGGQAGEPAFERAGVIAREAASPISDLRGPADYRVHLIGILVKRALGGAFDRARGGSRAPGITVG